MDELINKIKRHEKCYIIKKKCSDSNLISDSLPDDLKEFYSLCDGAILFEGEDYQMKILESFEIQLANPIIIGELCEEDISSKWYLIARDLNGDYITIDSRVEKHGYCYDSYWDRHGVPGECTIIAKSFSEMVSKLLEAKGKQCYWLIDDFLPIGDAYDEC